jgi:hypothetical protein
MADNSAQDRNLPASQRKITKAREDGQVARSRDLGHFAAFFAAGLLLMTLAPDAIAFLARLTAAGLQFDTQVLAGTQPMLERLGHFGGRFVIVVVPMGLLMMAVAAAAGAASGGWNFTWKAIKPKFSKLNPLSGLGRVFSPTQVGQALKACLLALVLGVIGAFFLAGQPAALHARRRHALAGGLVACGCGSLGRCDAAADGAGGVRPGGRAAAALPLAQAAAHEPPGGQAGAQGDRGQQRGQVPHAPAHARGRQPPHAGRGAQGRPGGDEPDPLCGGA